MPTRKLPGSFGGPASISHTGKPGATYAPTQPPIITRQGAPAAPIVPAPAKVPPPTQTKAPVAPPAKPAPAKPKK